jgi:hypothetical protein
MRFKMNVAKHTIAIFIIVGISGLLYTSSFLPSVFAQNTSGNGTGTQQQGAGTLEQLQNLTGSKENKELLANNTPISNSSLSTGLQLEQDTDKSKAGQETDEQKLGHNPQGQVGPALDQSTPQQNQTSQGQQQSGQNQTSQGQQQSGQNQTSQGQQQSGQNQSKGPLDQIGQTLSGLFGGKK